MRYLKKIKKEQNRRREEAIQSFKDEEDFIALEAAQSSQKWARRRQEAEQSFKEMINLIDLEAAQSMENWTTRLFEKR